jgi:hypothetical protein
MGKIQIVYSVLGGLGLILATTGYLIKYKSMIHLVAGVCKNDKRIKDKIGFASFVGGNVLALGIIFFVGALLIFNNPQYRQIIEVVLIAGVFMVISITFTNSRKYLSDEKSDDKQAN